MMEAPRERKHEARTGEKFEFHNVAFCLPIVDSAEPLT